MPLNYDFFLRGKIDIPPHANVFLKEVATKTIIVC